MFGKIVMVIGHSLPAPRRQGQREVGLVIVDIGGGGNAVRLAAAAHVVPPLPPPPPAHGVAQAEFS